MLVFLTDTIEYGQWKLGKRNEGITFSIQPFINKIGGAAANFIISMTVVIAGMNAAVTPADVTEKGIFIMKCSMLFLPLVLIAAGYLVYRMKYKIDENTYANIIADLKARGDIRESLPGTAEKT